MGSASRCRALVGPASACFLVRFTFLGGFERCTTPEKQEGVMAAWPETGSDPPLYFTGYVSTVFLSVAYKLRVLYLRCEQRMSMLLQVGRVRLGDGLCMGDVVLALPFPLWPGDSPIYVFLFSPFNIS